MLVSQPSIVVSPHLPYCIHYQYFPKMYYNYVYSRKKNTSSYLLHLYPKYCHKDPVTSVIPRQFSLLGMLQILLYFHYELPHT